jgi:hypothetical protein
MLGVLAEFSLMLFSPASLAPAHLRLRLERTRRITSKILSLGF